MGPGEPPKKATKSVNNTNNRSANIQYNVPTHNTFDKLNQANTNKNPKQTAPKPAPITITQKNINIREIADKINVNYTLKMLGIGTKIFLDTNDDRMLVEQSLVEKNIEFFSHPTTDQKTFKTVLRGLPELPTDNIIACLKDNNNISAQKVTMFKTNSTNKIYLIEFNKNDINKADLSRIKVVYNHIVHWEPYRKTKRGPTQCRKCGMYGHGMSHCHRITTCLYCGDKHDTSKCPLSAVNNKNANPIYKCANCVGNQLAHNHRSDDPDCPSRKKYLDSRTSSRTKPRPHIQIQSRFTQQQQPQQQQQLQQQQSFAFKSTADAVKFGMGTNPINNNNNNNLWSFAEVSQILFDSITELEKCKTKFDQLRVIASLLNNVCK